MNIQSLSKCYQVRVLHPEDVDQMYELAAGFQSAALAIDEGNPQSEAFWTKNGFKKEGEPIPNDFSSYIRMRKSLT